MKNFGYVSFLDSSRHDLHLFEINDFGQVKDECPLYGQEEKFKHILNDHKMISICEIETKIMPDGSKLIKTVPICKATIADKWRDVEHLLHGGSFDLLDKMYNDFYSIYVDNSLFLDDDGNIEDGYEYDDGEDDDGEDDDSEDIREHI